MSDHFTEALRLAVSIADRGETPAVTVGRAASFMRFLRGINELDDRDMRRAINDHDDRRMKDAE